jgi:hypothetical protein
MKKLPVMRVYLAGPYSGGDVITILHNIRQGIAAAEKLKIQVISLEMFLHEHALAASSHPVSPITIKTPKRKP